MRLASFIKDVCIKYSAQCQQESNTMHKEHAAESVVILRSIKEEPHSSLLMTIQEFVRVELRL